jgi:cell wall-associated NlpC family hydrolase
MSHWAERYVGMPWVPGESDCWSVARRIWREQFQMEVEALPVDPRDPLNTRRAIREGMGPWAEVQQPFEGDAVLMAQGRVPGHVGIWLSPGAVLHSIEAAGVIVTPLHRLQSVGYRVTGIYRRTLS